MLQSTLAENIALSLFIWAIVYLADYYITIYTARLYRDHVQQYIAFEGSYELTPQFQKDVDKLRPFSPRFLFLLTLSLILIWIVWALSTQFLAGPELFAFLLGALLLRHFAVHMRHFRNLFYYRAIRKHGGLEGRVFGRRWLLLRNSAMELLSFAALYGALYVFLPDEFFLGGVLSCLLTGIQHLVMSNRAFKAARTEAK